MWTNNREPAAGSQHSFGTLAAAGGVSGHSRKQGRKQGIGRSASLGHLARRLGVFGLALVALAGCRLITTSDDGEPEVVALSPSMAQVEEGETLRLSLTDASRADSREVTGLDITWESLSPAVATVQDGVVRGVSVGEARIRARLESGKVAETSVAVTRTPAAISLVGGNPQEGEVSYELPEPIEAKVVSRSGRPVPGAEVRFHVRKGAGSTSPVVAVADSDGVVRAAWTLGHVAGEQLLELEVRNANGVQVEARAEATPGPAQGVVVVPSQVSLRKGATVPLSAHVADRFGNVLGEYAVQWSSSNPLVAAVEEDGRVTGLNAGQADVEAIPVQEGPNAVSAQVLSDLAANPGRGRGKSHVHVSDGDSDNGGGDGDAVGSVSITGGNAQSGIVGAELGRELEIRLLDASGTPVRQFDVTWVVVKGNGTVSETTTRTNGQGRASVRWTLGPVAGEQVVEARAGSLGAATFTATAVAGSVDVVQVSPGHAEVAVGGAAAFSAAAFDRFGNQVTGKSVTWSVDDASVASVSSNGAVEGTKAGETQVAASVEGVKGAAELKVVAGGANDDGGDANGQRIEVTPDSAVVKLGGTLQLSATFLDASGFTVSDAGLEWSSLHPEIASVNSEGVVLSKSVGTALIVVAAVCCDVADTATVQVAGAPGAVTDLEAIASTDASVTLRWTEVDDGAGNPARYAVRFASPEVTWWLAAESEASVDGEQAGTEMEVELNGMAPDTEYEFQLVAYRGELMNGATFGELSNKDAARTQSLEDGGGSDEGDDDGSGGGSSGDGWEYSAQRPNEPEGFVPWFEHDWQSFPTDERQATAASGTGFFYGGGVNNSYRAGTLVNDPDAPHGLGKSLRIRYSEGHPTGSGVHNFSVTSHDTNLADGAGHTDLQEMYVSYWYLWEPNSSGSWHDGMTHWRHLSANRHVPQDCSASQLLGIRVGGRITNGAWERHDHWYRSTCGATSTSYTRAGSGPPIGKWVHFEYHWKVISDGEVRMTMWWNGELVLNRTVSNIHMMGGQRFRQLHFNSSPSGGSNPTEDHYFRISGVYVSGIPATGR